MKKLISSILCFCLCFGVIYVNVSAETATDGFDISPSDFVQRIGADANRDGKYGVADILKMRRVFANLERFDYS